MLLISLVNISIDQFQEAHVYNFFAPVPDHWVGLVLAVLYLGVCLLEAHSYARIKHEIIGPDNQPLAKKKLGFCAALPCCCCLRRWDRLFTDVGLMFIL